jgi:hypothetical protein
MADMAVTAAVVSGVASVGAAVVDTVSNIQNEEAQIQVSDFNRRMARDDARRTRAEYAMNAGLLRGNARRQIATAQNAMGATGNIGSSADASIYDSYLNLSSDLASMKYQYYNTAIKYLNEMKNHKFNKEVARNNKTGALLGGMLNVTAAASTGYLRYLDVTGQLDDYKEAARAARAAGKK